MTISSTLRIRLTSADSFDPSDYDTADNSSELADIARDTGNDEVAWQVMRLAMVRRFDEVHRFDTEDDDAGVVPVLAFFPNLDADAVDTANLRTLLANLEGAELSCRIKHWATPLQVIEAPATQANCEYLVTAFRELDQYAILDDDVYDEVEAEMIDEYLSEDGYLWYDIASEIVARLDASEMTDADVRVGAMTWVDDAGAVEVRHLVMSTLLGVAQVDGPRVEGADVRWDLEDEHYDLLMAAAIGGYLGSR